MLFIILSVLDVVAGAMIYSPAVKSVLSGAVLIIAIIVLAKGLWTFFTTMAEGYFLHLWAAALDVAAGAALLLILSNFMSASHILGGIVMAKGGWYLARSILKF